MEQTILPLLDALHLQGFCEHIYGSPTEGWFYKGKELLNAVYYIHGFIYDEMDCRVMVAAVTCGTLKGAAVFI